MGRLFWKFFFAFLASFFVAGSGVGIVVWLHHDQLPPGVSGPTALGERPPPPEFSGSPSPAERLLPPGVAQPPEVGPLPPRLGGPPAPSLLLPIAAAVIVSLLASALLAWYFAKPLRHLRWALGALADGHLDTRIGPQLADRRDEIADLGRDFDDMARRLQQTVEAQRRLLHDVSHELRSPLARLQVAVGLARQDPARIVASLDRVEAEVGRLDRLVGELLTLSRLEAGDDRQQKAPVEVMELLVTVVEDAHYEAKANGRDLEFQEGAEFVISGHRELLHRVFENVLRNAVKYTAPATCVSVTTRMLPEQRLSVLVCDRGPGVLPSELDTIFKPFHRGAGSGVEGFGLGLAIARRAVEAHGGSVTARNRDGGGLCVEILL
jgi:two-component system, OmpR family, sensor kinase